MSYWPLGNPRTGNPGFTKQKQGLPAINMPIPDIDTAIQSSRTVNQAIAYIMKKHKPRKPDLEVLLYSLDIKNMEQAFKIMIPGNNPTVNPKWSIWGGSPYIALPHTTNCSGLVSHLLTKGGIEKLSGRSRATRRGQQRGSILAVIIVIGLLDYHLRHKQNGDDSRKKLIILFSTFFMPFIGRMLGGFYDGWEDTQKIATVIDSIGEGRKVGSVTGTIYSSVLSFIFTYLNRSRHTGAFTSLFVASGICFLGIFTDYITNYNDPAFKQMWKPNLAHALTGLLTTIGYFSTDNLTKQEFFKMMMIAGICAFISKKFLFGEVVCAKEFPGKYLLTGRILYRQ